MSRGVELHHLRCPTCGTLYGVPLEARVDSNPADFDVDRVVTAIAPYPVVPWRWFVVCQNGHKWSIKEITRYDSGAADELLLGEYLGECP